MDGPTIRPVSPRGWVRPKGYSNGLVVPPGRSLVFVAGMVGWDASETVVSPDFCAQFEQALRNVVAVVEEAGGGPADVVRMLVFVTDKREYLAALREIGEAWRRVMGRHFPAMALVEVTGLVEDGAKVEIEAVAAI